MMVSELIVVLKRAPLHGGGMIGAKGPRLPTPHSTRLEFSGLRCSPAVFNFLLFQLAKRVSDNSGLSSGGASGCEHEGFPRGFSRADTIRSGSTLNLRCTSIRVESSCWCFPLYGSSLRRLLGLMSRRVDAMYVA